MGNYFAASDPLLDHPSNIDVTALRNARLPVLFVLGGPGSGKATQSIKISKKYGFYHISCGDLLRDEVLTGSPRGLAIAYIMHKGDLVPTCMVIHLLKKRMLANVQETRGFVIDGFPRDKSQAVRFEKEISPVWVVIYLKVDTDVQRDRLQGRAVVSGLRSSATDSSICRRIKHYRKKEAAIYNYFKRIVCPIEADRTIDDVFCRVCTCIDRLLAREGMPEFLIR